ncbi:MAG: 4-hydroxy-3-methylbut-2-enyl diphosphate reductase [Coriobacteriales bacterium]
MKVLLARPSGACFGVERALRLVRQAAKESGASNVYTLGPLIHNPIVVADMKSRGVNVAGSVDDVDDGVLVIRSHGVPVNDINEAREKGLQIVDATCPHVSRAQKEAQRLAKEGYYVIIIGDPGHPEVEAIYSYAGDNACVVEDLSQIPDLPPSTSVGVVVQTTQPVSKLEQIVAVLKKRYSDLDVQNTICSATKNRQDAAIDVARQVDAMVVIGGRNSGNTKRLFELCHEWCDNTHHIESAAELDPKWFSGCETVGVTAGASTPQPQVDDVVKALEQI